MAFNVQPFSEAHGKLVAFSIVPVANGTGGQDGEGIKGHDLRFEPSIHPRLGEDGIQLPQPVNSYFWKI